MIIQTEEDKEDEEVLLKKNSVEEVEEQGAQAVRHQHPSPVQDDFINHVIEEVNQSICRK